MSHKRKTVLPKILLSFNPKGVTFIELITAIVIFLIISYMVLSATLTSGTTSSFANAMTYLNSQAIQAVTSFTSEFIEAQTSSIVLGNDSGGGIYRNVVFSIPVSNATDELVMTPAGDPAFGDGTTMGVSIMYLLNGTKLTRQRMDATGVVLSARPVAQNVTLFTIRPAPGGYQVALNLSISKYETKPLPTPLTFNTTFTISPRN